MRMSEVPKERQSGSNMHRGRLNSKYHYRHRDLELEEVRAAASIDRKCTIFFFILGAYALTAFALSMLLSRHGALPLLIPSWLLHGYSLITGWFIYYLDKAACPQLNGELDWELQYLRDTSFTFFSYWDASDVGDDAQGVDFGEQLEVLRAFKYNRDSETPDKDSFLCIGAACWQCCAQGPCACCKKVALALYAPAVFLVDAQAYGEAAGNSKNDGGNKGCNGPAGAGLVGEFLSVGPAPTQGKKVD